MTIQLLQRGRACHSKSLRCQTASWRIYLSGSADYCREKRFGPAALRAVMVHLTLDPLRSARNQVGARAVAIVSHQQSVRNSKVPFFGFFFISLVDIISSEYHLMPNSMPQN